MLVLILFAFLVDPTKSLETSHAAATELAALRGHRARQVAGLREADAGLRLPVLGQAPEFADTQRWFNTPGGRPVPLASLRGHVVLVDFWTYTCINCIRTLPYVNAWYAKYRSRGFEVVGVHTPEFPFEHSAANVAAAVAQNGIRYPVVQDNEYGTWNAYNNEYWPAEYLIDAQGRIRLEDFGEGEYAAKERAIRSLLVEAGARGLSGPSHVHALAPSRAELTPESYLGTERGERLAGGAFTAGVRDYGPLPSSPLPLSEVRLAGRLEVGAWSTTALAPGAAVQLRFRARRVYLVMGVPTHPIPTHPAAHARAPLPVCVLLDGRPIPPALAGAAARAGTARVRFQGIYDLVSLPSVQTHTLTVEPAPGVSVYDFTFG